MSFDVVVSFDIGALNVIELNSFNPFFEFFSSVVSYVCFVFEFVFCVFVSVFKCLLAPHVLYI